MLETIDNFLNGITMYRLVLYYLVVLVGAALGLCALGLLPFSAGALGFSLMLILLACLATNWIFAKVFSAQPNIESVYITALILALVISPASYTSPQGIGLLVCASVWASASKYILAIGKRHLFNPAALAVALTALLLNEPATWWVGNVWLMPLVVVGGLLLVRKLQRFDLVLAFMAAALGAVLWSAPVGNLWTPLSQTLIHSSFFFFAFVMLTEPLTSPPGRTWRILYGALVGILFAPNTSIAGYYFTPEQALLVGNLFSYLVSPKGRYTLTLAAVEQVANNAYDFIFTPDRPFAFTPGQYMEWTLAHKRADSRGNRRYFTLASSPTSGEVRLGVKFYAPASSFKKALAAMEQGATLSVSHVAGGFTLPRNTKKKLVFIAGGIGITPFRSMLEYLLDKKERRDIILFYSNRTQADVAYQPLLERAEEELGVRVIYATGSLIDQALVAREAPDWRQRTFYISGPHRMVEDFKETLRDMGVSRFRIKSDFFPGFA